MKRLFFPLLVLTACGSSIAADPMPNGPQNPQDDAGTSPASDGGNLAEASGDASDPILDASVGTPENPRPFSSFSINHVLVTGQSNSVSNSGRPVLSKTQPFNNLMFSTGVMPMMGNPSNPSGGCNGNGCTTFQAPSGFLPLVEGDGFFNPLDGVETISSAAANHISFLFKEKHPDLGPSHDVLMTLHGRSGNTYWCLRKGGCNYKQGYLAPFDQALMEVSAAKNLAAQAGRSYVVRGVFVVHGESDHYSYTAGVEEFPLPGSDGTPGKIKDYADALIEWQHDYETSIRSITGQKEPVPLFVSQISGWNDARTSRLANMQLDAHVRSGGKVILVGPSYSLQLNQQDCLHFTSVGEDQLGEMFARAYESTILRGISWEPLRPAAVLRNGANIYLTYKVPTPPLVIDTARVASAQDFGFESSAGSIRSVSLTGANQVRVELVSVPVGPSRLRYAQNQPVPGCAGTPNGARGNIRDSGKLPSRNGFDQSNWGVHFDIEVP